MTKPIIAGTFLAAIFLTIGSYAYPIYPISWLASTSLELAIVRSLLAVLLMGLLFTNPPRKIYFRIILGVAAFATITVAVILMSQFKIAILDFLMLALASINFGIAAIEANPNVVWQDSLEHKKLNIAN